MRIFVHLPEHETARRDLLQGELTARWGHSFEVSVKCLPEFNGMKDDLAIHFGENEDLYDLPTQDALYALIGGIVKASRGSPRAS